MKMNKIFAKLFICFLAISMIFASSALFSTSADAAAKKKGKGGLSQEQLDTMSKDLNTLTKKIYANSLFSPKDNETMINFPPKSTLLPYTTFSHIVTNRNRELCQY